MGLTQKLGTIPLAVFTDSSNNVGIGGAANASYKLAVTGASAFWDGTQGLNIRAYTGGSGFGAIYSTGVTAGAGNFALAASSTQTILSGVDNVSMAINSAIKLYINSSGNVGIGTSSPTHTLTLQNGTSECGIRLTDNTNNTYFALCAANNNFANGTLAGDTVVRATNGVCLAPNNGSAVAMRITNGGSVQIANGYLSVSAGSGVGYSSIMQTSYNFPYIDTYIDSVAGPSYQGRIRLRTNAENGGFGDRMIIYHSGAINIPYLAGGGTRSVTALSDGTLSTSSDSRLKQEDKQYAIAGLKELLQITPKAYKWLSDIEQRGEDAQTELGFFADEVAPIIPSAAPKGQDDMYGFYDRSLMAVMVKAIQELNAKVTALENK